MLLKHVPLEALLGLRSVGSVSIAMEKRFNIRKFVCVGLHCATVGNELNNWLI